MFGVSEETLAAVVRNFRRQLRMVLNADGAHIYLLIPGGNYVSGNCVSHLLQQSVTLHSLFMFHMFFVVNSGHFLKQR
jgi:hypothetical protein